MRIVIQRVKWAKVYVSGSLVSQVREGLLLLLGIEQEESLSDLEWIAYKVLNMRIFNDDLGVMNKSVMDIGGEILVVSQFTLMAKTHKGNRPSYIRAARPEYAEPLYNQLLIHLRLNSGLTIEGGVFGADMQLELLNDGPVTIIIDSKNKEL